jgi:hypothetical protein
MGFLSFFDEEGRGLPRPPRWPGRGSEPAESSRWDRPPEPWERIDEAYPGEMVLHDLGVGTPTTGAATRILGRFAAVRFVRIATTRRATLRQLARERRLAMNYTSTLRAPPAEATALRAIVALARNGAPRRIAEFLHVAGEAARRSRHEWGALALHHEAYRLALACGWSAEAARAAAAISGLARDGGGVRSCRLWERRARVLFRRAIRAAE